MNQEKEIDFLRTYKDFIYYFNMLERNIGYCLRLISRRSKQQNPDKCLTYSFDLKIKKVIKLAKLYNLETLFHEWHRNVNECRHLRNIIAHGQWEWKNLLEKPIYYHAPEIVDGEGYFTTHEFREKLNSLQEISKSFHEIRTPLEEASYKSVQANDAGNKHKPCI